MSLSHKYIFYDIVIDQNTILKIEMINKKNVNNINKKNEKKDGIIKTCIKI